MTDPRVLHVTILGVPAAQGSKRHVGGGRMIEMSRAVGPWREAVRAEVQRAAGGKPFDGPVFVTLKFCFRRPRSHWRTGRNGHLLRAGAPDAPASRPDVDKLARAVLDGLTEGGAWHDDGQVVTLLAIKRYGDAASCQITVRASAYADAREDASADEVSP